MKTFQQQKTRAEKTGGAKMIKNWPFVFLFDGVVLLAFLSKHSQFLHVFKLIDTPFGVAFTDFPQRLVLVTTLLDILFMQPIHGRLFGLVLGAG